MNAKSPFQGENAPNSDLIAEEQGSAVRAHGSGSRGAGADRRDALITCAQELFFTAGYETTTVNDIIKRAELSKGGFYHHFSSKEELLDAVVLRMTEEMIQGAGDILENPDLDALSRLNLLFERTVEWKTVSPRQLRNFSEALFKPENVLLFHRVMNAVKGTLHPLITGIIEQGVAQGTFSSPDPGIVAEVFLSMAEGERVAIASSLAAADRGELDLAVASLAKRLDDEAQVMDRLLGLADGSLRLIVDDDALRGFFEAASPPAGEV